MNEILNFLTTHFEIIIALNVYWVLGLLVVVFVLRVRDIRLAQIQKFFKSFLQYILLFGQVLLLIVFAAVSLTNYTPKEKLDFSAQILGDTQWVKDRLKIYYIAGNSLKAIQADGQGDSEVFRAPGSIREYHFSPGGQALIVVTETDIYYCDLLKKSNQRIDSLGLPATGADAVAEGVIDGVQWSPDGTKIVYRLAKWSRVASQEQWWVYRFPQQDRIKIQSAARPINALMWDTNSQALYYSWFDALDPSEYANPYEVKVYKIDLSMPTPVLVLKFPFPEATLTLDHLALRGIDVFAGNEERSFGRAGKKHFSTVSYQGAEIGIDEDDMLYYRPGQWWRSYLYEIPRESRAGDFPRYEYKGGDLVIRDFRWFPSGRYVIMEHSFFGILILHPSTGKIGILINERGSAFGWSSSPIKKSPART